MFDTPPPPFSECYSVSRMTSCTLVWLCAHSQVHTRLARSSITAICGTLPALWSNQNTAAAYIFIKYIYYLSSKRCELCRLHSWLFRRLLCGLHSWLVRRLLCGLRSWMIRRLLRGLHSWLFRRLLCGLCRWLFTRPRRFWSWTLCWQNTSVEAIAFLDTMLNIDLTLWHLPRIVFSCILFSSQYTGMTETCWHEFVVPVKQVNNLIPVVAAIDSANSEILTGFKIPIVSSTFHHPNQPGKYI